MSGAVQEELPHQLDDEITQRLLSFSRHFLSDLGPSHLMNRVDRKFLLHRAHLNQLLDHLELVSSVLEVDDKLISEYRNTYFDDVKRQFYLQHHNRHSHRVKVRTRCYAGQDLHFLELKVKDNKGRTQKYRMLHSDFHSPLERQFLLEFNIKNAANLLPVQDCNYQRISLADRSFNERLTLDLAVQYLDRLNHRVVTLDSLIVVELKQPKLSFNSEFMRVLRKLRLKPVKFSKYCMGTRLTNPTGLKTNAFKASERIITKILGDQYYA